MQKGRTLTHLNLSFRFACGIELDDKVIITGGGGDTKNTASVYNDDGWVEDLAFLNTGRAFHACAHYTSDNELVKFVF